MPQPMGPPLCFGLIADIQHADKDTVSFEGRPQRYRESKAKLQAALADFASRRDRAGNTTSENSHALDFVLTLGDIIDGYHGDTDKTSSDLRLVAGMFDRVAHLPVYHVLGNHCLSAARQELLQVLHIPGSYYSTALGHGWRLIVLDTTEMSLHSGYPEDSFQMQEARQWLDAHPQDQHPNAQTWNGGCTSRQLDWLQEQLAAAAQAQQQVIVACHHPVAPCSAPDQYLAWDHDKLLAVLTRVPGLVRLVLSGHYHPGGYAAHSRVHFVVMEGVLEAPADSNAYSIVELHHNKVVVHGQGVARSRELVLS